MPLLLALLLLVMASPLGAQPLVIAHRGASADHPEHTLGAYRLAIAQGADLVEPDLVMTRDGVLVARHENEISGTTDVAERPEFAARRTRRSIDGQVVEGWFTEDFTLAELRTLRTRERLPRLRPANRRHDGEETIPTLDEIIALVQEQSAQLGRPIGLYPETKHPGYFRSIGLPMEELLVAALHRAGWREGDAPVFIQSFEVGNLQRLRPLTRLRLVQLVAATGAPADRPDLGPADMLSDEGLAAIATYADAIGPEKSLLIPRDSEGRLGAPTDLVARARRVGLAVHPWTFRPENFFLPADHRVGHDPTARGDAAGEIRRFLALGIDGFFTDDVRAGRAAVAAPAAAATP